MNVDNKKMIPIKCTQCGAELQVDKDQGKIVCKYCGSTFLIEQANNNYEIHNHINIEAGKTNYQSTLDFISDQLERKREEKRETQESAAKRNQSNSKRIMIVILCMLLVVAFLTVGSHLSSQSKSSTVKEMQDNEQGNGKVPKEDTQIEAAAGASEHNSEEETTTVESTSENTGILPDEGIAYKGTPRDGFNEETNKELSFYGYKIFIPNYYSSKDESGDTIYYYAETGKAVAMLMVNGTELEDFKGYEDHSDEEGLDEFVSGTLRAFSDYNPVILDKTNMIIADSPCCLVEVEGDFLEPSATGSLFVILNRGKHKIVSLMLLQSTNTRFDYSEDFNKIVLSIVKEE